MFHFCSSQIGTFNVSRTSFKPFTVFCFMVCLGVGSVAEVDGVNTRTSKNIYSYDEKEQLHFGQYNSKTCLLQYKMWIRTYLVNSQFRHNLHHMQLPRFYNYRSLNKPFVYHRMVLLLFLHLVRYILL